MKKTSLIKLLCLIIALTLVFSLSACGSKNDSGSSEPESSSSEEMEDEEEPEEVVRIFQIEKIDEAKSKNADTVGWLNIPNTEIDDPVVQAANNDYYLRLTFDKAYDIFGSYYADFRCKVVDRSSLSRNTIIYGHSDYKDNPEGKMFSQLYHYAKDIEFVKNNPYVYFSTENDDMVWQVFSVFYTHVDFYYIQDNPSDAEFEKILNEAKAKSEYIIDVPVTKDDKILTLSTCTGLFNAADKDNYRMVVMAKLLPSNEIPVSKLTMEVKPNPSPKRD